MKLFRALICGLLLMWSVPMVVNCVTPSLYAQDAAKPAAADAGGGAAAGGGSPGFTKIVFGGGPVNTLVWLLIFGTSFATITFMIDCSMAISRDKLLPAHVVAGVQAAIDDGDLGAAMGVCEQNPGPLSNILLAGFNNITEGYDIVQDAVGSATDMETERVMQRVNYLNLCGQIAPMLGLLGTVTGMVRAFASLAQEAGAAKGQMLALAISTALWTTVAGLLISVPALLAFTILRNLATKVLLESEFKVLDMIKVFKNVEIDDEEEDEDEEE